mgnify:CR=1 FL=1
MLFFDSFLEDSDSVNFNPDNIIFLLKIIHFRWINKASPTQHCPVSGSNLIKSLIWLIFIFIQRDISLYLKKRLGIVFSDPLKSPIRISLNIYRYIPTLFQI